MSHLAALRHPNHTRSPVHDTPAHADPCRGHNHIGPHGAVVNAALCVVRATRGTLAEAHGLSCTGHCKLASHRGRCCVCKPLPEAVP